MLLTLSSSQVDEDLMCQICLQPFVSPTDTPCSHTFCQVSIIQGVNIRSECKSSKHYHSWWSVNVSETGGTVKYGLII